MYGVAPGIPTLMTFAGLCINSKEAYSWNESESYQRGQESYSMLLVQEKTKCRKKTICNPGLKTYSDSFLIYFNILFIYR